MKHRTYKVIAISTALLIGGLCYAWICSFLGFGIPCLFRLITGWQCPGCGVTRMCMRLLKGDLAGAFAANPVLLVTLPGLIALLADATLRYIRKGRWTPEGWSSVLVLILTAILLIFGVLRNL